MVLDAAALDDAAMLAIAAEVGYSETAFVTATRTTRPRAAIGCATSARAPRSPSAGTPPIATAVALAERDGPGELVFDTAAGEIRVATTPTDGGAPLATLTRVPDPHPPADEATEIAQALAALRWSPDDLDPALAAARRLRGQRPPRPRRRHPRPARRPRLRLRRAGGADAGRRGWTTVHLVQRADPDRLDFHARDPFPVGGVVEDPATGAAAAAFGGYLRALGLVGGAGPGPDPAGRGHGTPQRTARGRRPRRHPRPRHRPGGEDPRMTTRITRTTRSFELPRFTGVDALRPATREVPAPGPREVLVRMRAWSLNYRDLMIASDTYGRALTPGLVPLSDGAGEVVDAGPEATRWAAGDRVVGIFMPRWLSGPATADRTAGALGGPSDGVLAQYVLFDQDALVAAPAHLDFAEAATLPCAAVTAWHAVVTAGGAHSRTERADAWAAAASRCSPCNSRR